ncbi:MAG: SCO family protein [Gammaproteobacteria bacterium]|nr:SCO family protein [Gammaproteobacteria bacterium]MBL6899222.1 SCO family protein [Gammaproteobacteria bacterium]
MQIFRKTKFLFLGLLFGFLVHSNNVSSDISKAFPDMSNVFERVDFYNKDNKFEKFNGYEDKVLLVFFGYTHCPDVCPTTVLDMARVMKDLGDQSENVLPMFISVDYDRDDYNKVRDYVDFFDSRIAALTSDKKNIDMLTKYFKTKYEFVDPKDKGYIVEHSSNIYVLDKNLQVRQIIPNGIPSKEITNIVKKFL